MPKPTYLIATDLSGPSRKAAEVAARLAARTRATLDFFCAVPATVVDEYGVDLGRARAAVAALAARHTEPARKAAAHVGVVRDVPSAILRQAQRAGATLIVVAPHGVTGWKKVLLGSVTEKVLRHAAGSVLVARPADSETLKRIVVGVDGSPAARATLRHAIALARALRAGLTVIHVVPYAELLVPFVSPAAHALAVGDRRLVAKTREIERWVASFPYRGVDVRTRVIEGSPAETLVAEAKRRRAGMIVVGATGKSGLRRTLLGSVAHAVASTSPVSVLVVREAR